MSTAGRTAPDPAMSEAKLFDLQGAIRSALTGAPGDRVLAYNGNWRDRAWLVAAVESFNALLADTGLVGLVARNRPLHVAACLANLAARRTTSMLVAGVGSEAFAATLSALRLPAVIACREDWTPEVLNAAREAGTVAIATDEAMAESIVELGSIDWRPVQASAMRSEVALELLSSGTTGVPKRIGLSWSSVAGAVGDALGAYAGTDAAAPQIMVHPLGNVSGLAYAIPPLVYGRPLVLLDRFGAESWARAVRDYRPRRGTVPPAGIAMLLEADVPPEWLESLELVAVGGGKLDTALHDAFENRFGIPVLTAYGATEFGGVVANWTLPDYRPVGRSKRGSAGRASRGVQLRIVLPDGGGAAPGEAGLLEARVDRIGPDWIRTTDIARIDADGFLFIEGRADAAINRGGFTIVPEVIADALRAHPDVRDAAVVGLPDARLGEVPVAAIEPVAGAHPDPAELATWLRSRLPPWQVPRSILVVAELPRTSTMKLSMPAVRALFETAG